MDRFNLGAHTRKIRTLSAEAQRWFDLGMNWCFGFNQEEGVKWHVLVRFGRWREIIAEALPADPEIYKVSIPMHHYARAIAYATLKDPVAADRERTLFREAMARIPADQKFLSNFAHATLGVGEAMLDGEVEYHRGNARRS